MNVSGASSMEQMQMRKMDGSGGGHGQGKGGMRDIMQNLSADDQIALKDELSTMSMEDRMAKVSQMKEVDSASMSAEEYTQTLLDILTDTQTNDAEEEGFSVYA